MYCPICFSEKTKSIFKNIAIDIERDVMFCESCNLFFVFPLPTADELDFWIQQYQLRDCIGHFEWSEKFKKNMWVKDK